MYMNNMSNISQQDILQFKSNVKDWLSIDVEIAELQKQLKELKLKKSKELEPKITLFMVHNNISDLKTENGKLKCSEKFIIHLPFLYPEEMIQERISKK